MARMTKKIIFDRRDKYFEDKSDSNVAELVIFFESFDFLLKLPFLFNVFQIGKMPERIDYGSDNGVEKG